MKRKAILWILGFSALVIAALVFTACRTVYVDPFFHYHEPRTDEYFYMLDNQRSQNDGIVQHFSYQGMITGTSMTENFQMSDFGRYWDYSFIKIPLEGATFRETGDIIRTALQKNEDLRIVIRGLDMTRFGDGKDDIRTDLGDYPTYLYDDDPFNDVNYVFNRDVVFSRVYPMTRDGKNPDAPRGVTSFDEYSNWMAGGYAFGKNALYPDGVTVKEPVQSNGQPGFDPEMLRESIRQNVTALAEEYPNVQFYCFFPPYSAKWWQEELESGRLDRQIETERIVIEELLRYRNIWVYSFNNMTNITTDLNNYKDATHYGDWINSLMVRYMYEDRGLLTAENYKTYLEEEKEFYSTFDYAGLNDQEDYEDDSLAASLLADEIYGRGY